MTTFKFQFIDYVVLSFETKTNRDQFHTIYRRFKDAKKTYYEIGIDDTVFEKLMDRLIPITKINDIHLIDIKPTRVIDTRDLLRTVSVTFSSKCGTGTEDNSKVKGISMATCEKIKHILISEGKTVSLETKEARCIVIVKDFFDCHNIFDELKSVPFKYVRYNDDMDKFYR